MSLCRNPYSLFYSDIKIKYSQYQAVSKWILLHLKDSFFDFRISKKDNFKFRDLLFIYRFNIYKYNRFM